MVVGRSITGSEYCSESSSAVRTISYASRGDDGSSTGILANMAMKRLSCSVWELWGPGSSAQISSIPLLRSKCAALMNGSAATFRPTCFMTAQERTPVKAALTAISNATFSLTPHSTTVFAPSSSAYPAIAGRISDDGVPG